MSLDNHIEELRRRHDALDAQILELKKERGHCSLSMQALKKQKCALKTEIARLTGDILANPDPDCTEEEPTAEDETPEPPVQLTYAQESEVDISEPSLPGANEEPVPYNAIIAAE